MKTIEDIRKDIRTLADRFYTDYCKSGVKCKDCPVSKGGINCFASNLDYLDSDLERIVKNLKNSIGE